MIDPNDPTSLHIRRYHADGRVTAFVNGKELGEPEYKILFERWKSDTLTDYYGEPARFVRVAVTEVQSGEVVASMQAREAELRPPFPYN
jgi:hypothetical protein